MFAGKVRRRVAMEYSSTLAFSFFLVSIQLFALTFAQSDKQSPLCSSDSTYDVNSTFATNLDSLFGSILTFDTPLPDGFYNVSYGQDSDPVNAIGLCRGDVDEDGCRSCINDALDEMELYCPYQKEAISWNDECMFRYSNRSIFGKLELEPSRSLVNENDTSNVADATQSNEVLTTLLDGITSQAASGDSRKFATGNATASDSQTIYAVAQCTPDLSSAECNDCLSNAAEKLSQCCSGKQGARLFTPSCIIRYDTYMFYESSVDLSPASPPARTPASPPTRTPASQPSHAPAEPPTDAPTSPPTDAPASPPTDAPASPPVNAPASPPVNAPPPLWTPCPPPPFLDRPDLPPPPSAKTPEPQPPPYLDTPELPSPPPPPPPYAETPGSPVQPPNHSGKGNMNSRFQALATVVPLMILHYFAF